MATITYTVTVANSGSGNVFYIDGSPNPTLSFSRGNTYVFDVSDSSNSGHPLRFKDGSGSTYSTDVTVTNTEGTTGAKVQIVIGATTPAELRYYCTVHGNYMGNTISVAFDATYVAKYGTGEYGKAVYGAVPSLTTLTGVSGTGQIQTVAVNGFEIDISERLVGVSATAETGGVTASGPSQTKIIDSVSATGSVGSVRENLKVVPTGVSATGSVNTVFENSDEGIAGVSATGFVGSFTLSNTHRVTSVGMTGSIGAGTYTGVTLVIPVLGHSKVRTFILTPSQARRVA
jgi:hypothetical protein